MIKHKKYFYLSIILFLSSVVLNFPYPNEYPLGENILTVLSIPVKSENGLLYVGIIATLLLMSSLIFLSISLEKYKARFALLALILFFLLPSILINSFQHTLAKGIYAISYDRDKANCRFTMVNENTLKGVCDLTFENNSRKAVQFDIEFFERENGNKDDFPMLSLMNNTTHVVKLKANEMKTIRVESLIDVSNMQNHVEEGEASIFNIIIKSEKGRRIV